MHETFPNIIPENFDFKEVSKDDVRKDIRNLNVESTFPEELEHSEVIPVYKKLDPLKKENYRPVILLPHVSKVFERIIYQQINTYMKDNYQNVGKVSENLTEPNICLYPCLRNGKKQLTKENMFLHYSWIFQKPFIQLIMTSC